MYNLPSAAHLVVLFASDIHGELHQLRLAQLAQGTLRRVHVGCTLRGPCRVDHAETRGRLLLLVFLTVQEEHRHAMLEHDTKYHTDIFSCAFEHNAYVQPSYGFMLHYYTVAITNYKLNHK